MSKKNIAIKQLVGESINKFGKTFEMLKDYDSKPIKQEAKKVVKG
jgi:hypothetical protein